MDEHRAGPYLTVLRDQIATAALAAFIAADAASCEEFDSARMRYASAAYLMADAMLKAREETRE
jgi:hypothetical protein